MGEVPANLEVMDLQARGVNDEALGYGGWLRKGQLHVRAKANDYQTNKPHDDGDWWAHQAPGTAGTSSSGAPRCNLPTAVAKISARIPAAAGTLQYASAVPPVLKEPGRGHPGIISPHFHNQTRIQEDLQERGPRPLSPG